MAAAFARCGKLRAISRLITSQQSTCLTNCLTKKVPQKKNNLVLVFARPLCASAIAENPSKSQASDKLEVVSKKFDLSFEDYQKLKRKIRSRQRIAGLPIAAVALMTSSAVSAYLNPNMFDAPPDQIQPIMGLDPLIFCGLCGVASAGVGYVVGSALFRSLWRIFNKDLALKMDQREADFLQRISSNRAASFSRFEDDYYGESIKTLSDYRQWLREQQKKKKVDDKFQKSEEEDKAAEAN